MAFTDFTNTPSNGATITANGVTYTYNSTKARWEVTAASAAAAGLTSEEVQDLVGAQIATNGSHTGISFSYDDAGDGAIDATIATLNQNTTGSAATLTTARNIGGVSFDGSADINLPGVNAAGTQNTTGSAATLTTARNIGGVSFDGSADINLPGVNAEGTQNTTGSAATLTTSRSIAGVAFNGSADISLPGVNTTGNQDTTGNSATSTTLATARNIGGVSFNGSADINLPGVNATGNQNTTGSAATLTTARNIGGVSFDGSADINLPGVNVAGNQDTSGNAATATTLATARSIGGVSFNGSADIIPNIVTDTTPQLGGSLDVNGNTVTSTNNGNIEIDPDGSGLFKIKGNSTAGSGSLTLNCELNSHGIKLQGPPHSAGASYTLTFPDNDGNADQVIKSDGSGNLAFVDQVKTIQTELTISDAASAGDVIVYEAANSQYATAGESTTAASVTQTTTSIDYLGTTNSSDGLGQALLVPAYSNKIFQLTSESGSYYYRWATLAGGGSVTISSSTAMPSNSNQITNGPAFMVASNKIALIGSDSSNTYYNIGTVNTSTGAITWGTNATLYSGATSWDSPNSIVYDDNDGKWILVGGSNIRALTYNSSNDTFTVGTAVAIGGSHNSVAYDPVRDAGLVVYTDSGNNYCRKWTSSSGAITLDTAVQVTNTTLQSSDITGSVYFPTEANNPHIFYIPNRQKFMMIYSMSYDNGFGAIRSWPVGFNSVTIEANGTLTVAHKDTDVGANPNYLNAAIAAAVVDTDTNTLVYFSNGSYNNNRNLSIGRITMGSNGSMSFVNHTYVMSHSNSIYPGALVYKSNGQVYGFTRYANSGSYGVQALDGEFYGIQNTVTGTNISNPVVGIAEEAISAGGTGTVNLVGGLDNNQSSLTVGSTYYLTSNGTLNTTADSYNVKMGVAVSATELLMEHTTVAAGGSGDIEGVTAGTGLSGGGTSGSVTLNLADTAVTAATYGSATTVPQIVVDAQGRVTSASNVTITAGSSIDVSDTAPSSPSSGDLWFNSSNLRPYIYYADGDSSQWIEFANSNGGGAGSGALALGELTNVSSTSPSSGQVLKWSGSEWAPAADSTGTGGIASVAADTTPQLGGALDVNGQDIVSTSNGDIELDPNGSGVVIFKGNATKGAGQFKLNCENNSHGITIKGPPHSAAASYTLTLPNNDGDANQVLKTDGSGGLSWTTPASAGATSIDDLSDAVYNSTALSLFLGHNAGAAVTNSASANVAVGVGAGYNITSANYNVLLGYNAGNQITTGSKNIVIGGQAYNAISSNGSHNILIGYNAEATSTSTNNEMTIGTASGDGLINNVRIPGVDFTMNTTALHYGAEIRADGDVVAYYSSDERLKENIEIIPNALSKVQQIRGVTFDWTDEYLEKQGGEDGYFHRKHDSGVIAQDVEKVLPELVAERPDGTKAVRYEKLVAVLIEAVKELKQEIEELKGEK